MSDWVMISFGEEWYAGRCQSPTVAHQVGLGCFAEDRGGRSGFAPVPAQARSHSLNAMWLDLNLDGLRQKPAPR